MKKLKRWRKRLWFSLESKAFQSVHGRENFNKIFTTFLSLKKRFNYNAENLLWLRKKYEPETFAEKTMIFTWLPSEAFIDYKIFLKYPQEFFLSGNALIIMQRITLINDNNQDQWIMPSNLIRSAPIAFDICAIRNTDVLYLQFFRITEVLRGVCRLGMCLKISGRIFSFGKGMNYNEENPCYCGK